VVVICISKSDKWLTSCSNRCGLQFMPYAPLDHSPANSEIGYPQALRTEAPTPRRTKQSSQHSAWDFDFVSENTTTRGRYRPRIESRSRDRPSIWERRRRAQQSVAVFCVFIKAVTSFLRLAARLRKREEEELRSFKRVHIRASLPKAQTTASDENASATRFSLERNGKKSDEVFLRGPLVIKTDLHLSDESNESDEEYYAMQYKSSKGLFFPDQS
jgi:hypothetical protein